MALPPRKKPVKSGISRAPRREFPKHRKWVRSHECCVAHVAIDLPCAGPVQFAHKRFGTDGGTGLKPSDWFGLSLCHAHHRQQHEIGEWAFEALYGIDTGKLAREFAEKSPDLAMREAMKEAERV